MNEQLVVKNFGPIKDATVDFKRVTVFIGPTGGGKSTLAKLAAILKTKGSFKEGEAIALNLSSFKQYSIDSFFSNHTYFHYRNSKGHVEYKEKTLDAAVALTKEHADTANQIGYRLEKHLNETEDIERTKHEISETIKNNSGKYNPVEIISRLTELDLRTKELRKNYASLKELADYNDRLFFNALSPHNCQYIPAERAFLSAIDNSFAGLMRDDIGLPKTLLKFANDFFQSRGEVFDLEIPFLGVSYFRHDNKDFISFSVREAALQLHETASGIQSVTPLLVLLEHLSRNTEQAQSFIIEEPELNLFPTAQFELVKILVDKCARIDGQNDLVLTTHSPYVLTALNLMCYAFRIAQQDEATAKKVDKLIPRHCWIDPDQFAAYYVDRPDTKRKQQVRSIINKKTGLIEENELDTASDELSSIFDKLVRLRKPTKTTARVK